MQTDAKKVICIFFQMRALPPGSVLLKQCFFCRAIFPHLATQIMILHLQFHVEQKHKRRGRQIECRQRKLRSRKQCHGLSFEIPEQMAIHCHEKHCRSFWVQEHGPDHEIALQQTKQEKDEMIMHLSQIDMEDVWIYFPPN